MILRLYRTNQPVVLIGIPVIALILWSMYFFYQHILPSESRVLPLFFDPNFSAVPDWLSKLLMCSLIVAQALLFNRMLTELEIFDKNLHLPSLVYLFSSWIFLEQGGLDVFAISNLFILTGVWNILSVYRQHESKSSMFNAGFLFGIAVLLSWPLVILMVVILLGVNLLKSFNWRDWFLFILGVFLPLFFFQIIYFALHDSILIPQSEFGHFYFNYLIGTDESTLIFLFKWMILFLFFISLIYFLNRFKGVVMRIRKQRQFLLFFSFSLIGLFVVYNGFFRSEAYSLLIIPFSFFTSFILIHIKMRTVLDIYFYLLLILVFIYRYGTFL